MPQRMPAFSSLPVHVLILLLNFAYGTKRCSESLDTMQTETSCPSNELDWNKAAEEKQCSFIKQNCTEPAKFVYHCLKNSHLNILVSVCAPVYFLTGKCPEFNIKGERLQPINDHCSTCLEWFGSNEVYKYPECFTTNSSTTVDQVTVPTTPDMKHEPDNILDILLAVGIVVGLLSVAMVILICIFVVVPRLRTERVPDIEHGTDVPLQQ